MHRPRRHALLLFALAALLLVALPPLPGAAAEVVLTQALPGGTQGHALIGPLDSVNRNVRILGCTITGTGSVPFGPGSPRGAMSVQAPPTCRPRTTVRMLPLLTFTDGLANTPGTRLQARLVLESTSGDLAMVQDLQLYLQRLGGRNPIITGTHIHLRNGVVVSSATSLATIALRPTYGPGFSFSLYRPAAPSTVTLELLLEFNTLTGGRVGLLSEEAFSLSLTY